MANLNAYQLQVVKKDDPKKEPTEKTINVTPSPKGDANWTFSEGHQSFHLEDKDGVKSLLKQLGYKVV